MIGTDVSDGIPTSVANQMVAAAIVTVQTTTMRPTTTGLVFITQNAVWTRRRWPSNGEPTDLPLSRNAPPSAMTSLDRAIRAITQVLESQHIEYAIVGGIAIAV